MLHKRPNPVVTFFLLLALFGVSKPAKAFILAQADGASTTFVAPDKLPQDAKINIAASNSTDGVSSGLQESFVAKYPQATVNINTQDSGKALNSLASGEADIAAIGRLLTEEEKARGLTSIPISREKIAIVVSPENTYDGNLTIEQFAQIFRGEITDWSEIGGAPGAIQLVDLPDTNDTRQAFPNYPVFQSAEFSTGSNTTKLDEDSNDAMVAELGKNGIGYAVAGDVIDRDDVKIVTMHQTQPDDPRYPFSQPFSLVYQGTPSEAAQAYLGFAGSEGTKEVVASRVGSISPSRVAAVVSGAGVGSGLANGNADNATDTPVDNTDPEADLDKIEADVDAVGEDPATNADKAAADLDKVEADTNAVGEDVNEDIDPNANSDEKAIADAKIDTEGSGEVNPDVEGSGELLNSDVEGSGEVNPELEGGSELNPELEDSGKVNVDVEDSGKVNVDVEGSGEPLNSDVEGVNVEAAAPNEAVDGEIEVAEKKGGRWWLWLLPLLAIPILGALLFGGKKRSDREPALDNFPDPNRPDGDTYVSDRPEDGGVPPVGANVSGNAERVVETETTNRMGSAGLAAGGAALAGGAAAAAKRGERDIDPDLDLDIDRSPTAAEIPSNPVTEFTGQETKLQVSDQSTKLQTSEDYDLDTDAETDGNIAAGGASSMFEREGNRDGQDLNFNETSTGSINVNSTNATNPVGTDVVSAEFAGDYVLPEESKTDADTDIDSHNNSFGVDIPAVRTIETPETNLDSGRNLEGKGAETYNDITTPEVDVPSVESTRNGETEILNRADRSTDDAIPGARPTVSEEDWTSGDGTATSDTFNRDRGVDVDDTVIAADDSAQDTELNIGNRLDDVTALDTDVDLDANSAETDFSLDADADLDRGTGSIGNASKIGGAAALGGAAAAASDMFNRDRDENVDDSAQDTELNIGNRLDDVTALDTDVDLDANSAETDFSADADLDRGTGSIGNASKIGGAAALGGAAAAASDMFNRDRDENVDDSAQDTELNIGNRLDDVTALDTDVDLDANSAETDFSADADLDRGTGSIGNASKIGGAAAASDMFNRDRDENVDDSAQDTELNIGNRLDDVTALDTDVDLDANSAETDFSLDADLDRGTGTVDRISDTEGAATSSVFEGNVDEIADDSIQDTELNPNIPANSDTLENIIDLRQNDSRADLSDLDTFVDSSREIDLADNLNDLEASRTSETFERDTERNTAQNTSNKEEFEAFETSFDSTTDNNPVNFADNVVADAETVDTQSRDISLENVGNADNLDLESMDLGLQDDNAINASLEEISFDNAATDDLTLEEISQSGNTTGDANLENANLETNTADIRLEEISFDEAITDSGDPTLEDLNLDAEVEDISLDDLGFEESTQKDTDLNTTDFNLSSDRPVNTSNLANDRSNDMNNISEWLDSLETPTQNNDNITDWLETLDKDTKVVQSSPNTEANTNLEAEADDISFQFLEDLLERDDKEKRNDG